MPVNFLSPIAVLKFCRAEAPSSALQQPFRTGDARNYISKASPDQKSLFLFPEFYKDPLEIAAIILRIYVDFSHYWKYL